MDINTDPNSILLRYKHLTLEGRGDLGTFVLSLLLLMFIVFALCAV